jgi:hypothetical protein
MTNTKEQNEAPASMAMDGDKKRRHLEGCPRCGRWDRDDHARLMCCCWPERYAEMHPEPSNDANGSRR